MCEKRLAQEEKAHRSEMTHSKMRYDNKIALLQEETQSTQMHLEKARRERDTLRYLNNSMIILVLPSKKACILPLHLSVDFIFIPTYTTD